MRAITGTVLSSKPCSLARAVSTLADFIDSAASHLPSSDAATYLGTATDAANHHHNFRRRLQHQGDTFEGDQKHVKLQPSGDQAWERILEERSSPVSDKRRKKKEKAKHVEEEDEKVNVQHTDMLKAPDGGLQASQPVEIDKKKKKHNKQEGEVRGAKEVDKIIVSYGATEQETASKDKENKRKKNKQHAEEEEVNKGRNVNGGDLGSDKKRKSKRTRGDSNDGDIELGEHTKKKSRKQTGN